MIIQKSNTNQLTCSVSQSVAKMIVNKYFSYRSASQKCETETGRRQLYTVSTETNSQDSEGAGHEIYHVGRIEFGLIGYPVAVVC